jgi:hypothetical protein
VVLGLDKVFLLSRQRATARQGQTQIPFGNDNKKSNGRCVVWAVYVPTLADDRAVGEDGAPWFCAPIQEDRERTDADSLREGQPEEQRLLKSFFIGTVTGGGEAAGFGAVEVFFAEGEAEGYSGFELDGEGLAFFEGGFGDLSADLGAEGIAVFGFAIAYGEVGQEDVRPLVEGEEGRFEAEADEVLNEFDGDQLLPDDV